MRFLILLSLLVLGNSLELGSVYDIDELMTFIKGAKNRLAEASEELNGIEIDGTKKFAEVIDTYLLQIDHTDESNDTFQEVKDLVSIIDNIWEKFGTKDPGDDKSELAISAAAREELYELWVGKESDEEGLPEQITHEKYPVRCDYTMAEQLRQSKLHQAVALTVLRGFILGLKAGEDNQKAVAKGILQLEQIILAGKKGFDETDDFYRACDPPEHIRGETYGEFVGLFQGVVVNDGHTNNRDGTGECGTSCDELDDNYIDRCYKRRDGYGYTSHCFKKKCTGRLYNCFHVQGVQTCELDTRSDRRFLWAFSYGLGKIFGNEKDCNSNGGRRVNILESGFLGANTCLTCMCVCSEEDQNTKAIRTVSLMPQFSDILNNMVITGVRFQLKDKVFQVQIEQSKLGALGEIVPGTSEWKKLPSLTFDRTTGELRKRQGFRGKALLDNIDYKFINKDERYVFFDELKVHLGEIMVGVKLSYHDDDTAIHIEILSWPFDLKTGQLKDPIDLDQDYLALNWINWENTRRRASHYDNERFEMFLGLLDDPAKAPINYVLSDPNDMLQIGATGFTLDMAQHTIPYLTLQDSSFPEKKAALRSLELYYARSKGYGGFIGFRIGSYDFVGLFKSEMTQEDIDKYQADFDGELPKDIPVKSE